MLEFFISFRDLTLHCLNILFSLFFGTQPKIGSFRLPTHRRGRAVLNIIFSNDPFYKLRFWHCGAYMLQKAVIGVNVIYMYIYIINLLLHRIGNIGPKFLFENVKG